jgi:hypothetical protein
MNLDFKELRCPCCGSSTESGNTTIGLDVQMVKRCRSCDFWMIIVIPNKQYDYSVLREPKKEKTPA